MKYFWISFVLFLVHHYWSIGCSAKRNRRSNKKHKTDNPSNPMIASIQETPGLQPRSVPKIKETSLPSATAGEGDNPSLNNPKPSEDEAPSPSTQSSSQSSTSSPSQSLSSPDSAVATAVQGVVAGVQNGQLSDADEVPNVQNSDSNKLSNIQGSESSSVNNGQVSDSYSPATSQNSDTNSTPNSQLNEPNGAFSNQANELNFAKSGPNIESNASYSRENSAATNGNDVNNAYNVQSTDTNTSLGYRSDSNTVGSSQVNAPVPVGTAHSPVQIVVSTTNNNNNTAMNGNIGQPAPELIVPVAVAPQSEKQESNENNHETMENSSSIARAPKQTALNVTNVSTNFTSPIATNTSNPITSQISPPKEQIFGPNVTTKPEGKTRIPHKSSRKNKVAHKRGRYHHHHHHKRRRSSKKSKRPYSEPVPETGVDKTTPKFDFSKYENMTKLIAKMQGGGSDIPTFNIGKLLSLFPNEVGIRKEDIPNVLQSFVNADGSVATQDDIAKMDREAVDADKNVQAAAPIKPMALPKGHNHGKVVPQNTEIQPLQLHSGTNKAGSPLKTSGHGLEGKAGYSSAIVPEHVTVKPVDQKKPVEQKKPESIKNAAPGNTLTKPSTKLSDHRTENTTIHREESKFQKSTQPHSTDVKPVSTPPSVVQEAIPPEPPLSLFTGAAPPTAKATIAETIAADTGQKLSEEVSKTAGISVPENIPKECGGLIKAYTNGEMTMKEYLQKMRRCKYINNPNKGRYQQALLKKGSVSKLISSDAEISQQAYKYALERMKDYVPSKKDTAQANAILEKWRTSTFGNRASNRATVPDAIKSFMNGQTTKKAAVAAAAAMKDAALKSTIKEKPKDSKEDNILQVEKNAILSQITGKSGDLFTASSGKNKQEEKGKVSSELIEKTMGLESSANLELLDAKKGDIPKPNPILSLSKIDALQKLIEQKTSIRSSIPKAPNEAATDKSSKPLPELTFKDAVVLATKKDKIAQIRKSTLPVKASADHSTPIVKAVAADAALPATKKSILSLLDHTDTVSKADKSHIKALSLKGTKKSTTPGISGIVSANLIRALQSMGPGQGFSLLGNKGMTLIATASKRSAEKDVSFEPRKKRKHRKRSLHKSERRNKKREVGEKENSDNASERSRMDMPPNIKPGPKLMDKIRDMSSVIATP